MKEDSRYLIELKIIAQDGTSSVCYAEAYGLTGNSLHVELFWDLPSDVDLHVMNPTDQNLSVNNIDIENPSLDPDLENWRSRTNSEWWSGYGTTGTGRDCHYSNCKSGVAWGVPGENDDPSLDRDDITGTGPENINVAAPKEGWYRVSIHYFSSSDEGTDAHTRIYCNGVVAYQNSTFLKNTNETWLVNDIYWEDLGNGDGRCTIFSDGRIYSERQGSGAAGYKGNLIEDIEPDNE